MPYSTRIGILGLMAIIASAGVMTGMGDGDGAPRGCNFITACPTSQMSAEADIETCTALIPDLKGQVQLITCPEVTCCRIEQTPEPGTAVAIGQHEIRLTAIVCMDQIPARGDDNSMCNDSCMGAICTSIGECLVNFQVFEPNPQLQCPESVDPIHLNNDCTITVPDLRNDVAILACTEVSGIEINQDPAPGTIVFNPGFELEISFNLSEIDSCSVFVPILPVTECPADFTLFADDAETCATSMPADLCDAYLPECQVEQRLGFLYSCRTEPEAGALLPVGDTEVRLIIENCFGGMGAGEPGNGGCIEITELSCSLTITVEGPEPVLKCPEESPEIAPLQISQDCTVVVPDLRDLVTVNACMGTEFDLQQYPEPGSTREVSELGDLYVEVYLDFGKGSQYCYFFVPLTPYFDCDSSPLTVFYDENCEAVIPDLTDRIDFADCCDLIQESRADSRCGEIRITQTPAAGSPLTMETEVSIVVERCYSFSEQPVRGVQEECELIGSCVVVVTPVDDTPPVIANCPDDLTIGADADCLGTIPDLLVPDVTGLAIATDNCTPTDEIVLTQTPAPGSEIGLGTIIVTVTATDASGNSTTCSVTIELEENGCLNPPAPEPMPEPEPEPQPVPGCDPNTQSVNLLFSLLFHSPVCGATCPIAVSMMAFGFLALRRNVRRKRK